MSGTMSRAIYLVFAPCFLFAVACRLAAAEPVSPPIADYPDLRLMEDLFGVELAATNPRREIELSISPRIADPVKRGYIRFPLRLKYGFTDNWEGGVRIQPYVDNPFRDGGKSGLEDIRFSTKYRLGQPLFGRLDSALGINVTLPLEDETKGITDGYRHFTPFVALSRTYDLGGGRQFQWFTSAEYDILDGDPDRGGKPGKMDKLSLFPGVIYAPPGYWRYLAYAEWDTTRIAGGDDDEYYLVPGLLYDPPRNRHPWLPGDWEFEFGGRIGLTGDSDDDGFILKVKIDFDAIARRVGYDPNG